MQSHKGQIDIPASARAAAPGPPAGYAAPVSPGTFVDLQVPFANPVAAERIDLVMQQMQAAQQQQPDVQQHAQQVRQQIEQQLEQQGVHPDQAAAEGQAVAQQMVTQVHLQQQQGMAPEQAQQAAAQAAVQQGIPPQQAAQQAQQAAVYLQQAVAPPPPPAAAQAQVPFPGAWPMGAPQTAEEIAHTDGLWARAIEALMQTPGVNANPAVFSNLSAAVLSSFDQNSLAHRAMAKWSDLQAQMARRSRGQQQQMPQQQQMAQQLVAAQQRIQQLQAQAAQQATTGAAWPKSNTLWILLGVAVVVWLMMRWDKRSKEAVED